MPLLVGTIGGMFYYGMTLIWPLREYPLSSYNKTSQADYGDKRLIRSIPLTFERRVG